jgi:5-methylthioadenosine/S-adenosylhomocysteine deaminase
MKLLHGGRVLLSDPFRFEPLDVVIEGERIRELVPPGSVRGDVERISAVDRLVVPGLVNGHHHAQTSLTKGLFDRYSLELYLNALPWALGGHGHEDTYLSAVISAAELVRKGCTATYDMFGELPLPTVDGVDALARGYADVGMRAVIAPLMADRSFYQAIPGLVDALPADLRAVATRTQRAPAAALLEACETILRDWRHDRGKLRPALGPTIPHHCSDGFLSGCRDLAAAHGAGIQMHVAESKVQAAVGPRIYGKSLVAHLDEVGLLGPGFCAAHAVWLDDEDRRRLSDRGATVSHNPASNLKLGAGVAELRRLLDAGVTVALGTDGATSADTLNLFEVMRFASYLSRVREHPPEQWVTAREVLRAATESGARALGFPDIGRLAPGFKADLVLLDCSAWQFVPENDLVSQVVFGEDGTGVESVMIGGRLVLDRGRFTTIDPARVRARVQAAVERLRAASAETRRLCELLAPHVGHYCRSLVG